jgi:chemotaxis methyl-accepting protein methylase
MDFSGYRRPTVERRIANRMMSLGIASRLEYLERLRSSRDEAEALLGRIAIKVSRFYRNPEAFELLRRELLPDLRGARPLRAWCAGCGNGEEAYTVAMLLDEAGALGAVEATDIDPAALAAGERAVYPLAAAEDLPLDLAARYLAPVDNAWVEVGAQLRRRVRFTRHDLVFAALPGWTGFDLVSCRNVLIYLQSQPRREALRNLCAALRPGGLLFLGEAEWPPELLMGALEPVAHGARIFRYAGKENA